MLSNNLKLSIRNFKRNRAFSFINMLGLSIGLACCIIIGIYAYTEYSFDSFHANYTHIYRVNKVTNEKGQGTQRDALSPGQLAPAVLREIPEAAQATRIRPWFNEMLVSYDTTRFELDNVVYADDNFLQMFSFPLVKGNASAALKEPGTAVLTEATAAKYFGRADPIGKTLVTLNNIPVKVTGVAKDLPFNSSINFTMLISWATIESPAYADNFSWMTNWTAQADYSFVQLQPGAEALTAGKKISALLHTHFPEKEFQYRSYLQPLSEVHLGSADVLYAEPFKVNSTRIIYTLLIIAGFILLIACFNFINLTTAGALSRAKETGVQKALGASQFQLVIKFFTECFVLCLVSMVLALVITSPALPLFNELAQTDIGFGLLLQPQIAGWLVLLLVVLSLAAGLYPSLFLARFKTTDVFRNVVKAGKDGMLRKSLVTTQFALSVLLIIGTIVVNRQMQYVASKDLGFNKDQVVVIRVANTGVESNAAAFVNTLKQQTEIASVSTSNRIPGQGFSGYGIIPEGRTLDEHLSASVLETDADFTNTYNIPLVNGRYFSPQMPTDTTDAIVINEAMARYLNWRQPVGKQLEIFEARKGKVIGVVKDFNFASLRETVQPLAMILNNNALYVSVKLKAGSIAPALAAIERTWKQFDKEYPFSYFFLDEQLNHFYQSDSQLLQALSAFAGIAIFIACIGLFGLSIYIAKQRNKEIGIRKVLGASVSQIVLLISKDFLAMVTIAILVASPLAWWASHKWLEDFAYHITMQASIFFIAGLAAVWIALLTISFQAIQAALANPIKSLRTE